MGPRGAAEAGWAAAAEGRPEYIEAVDRLLPGAPEDLVAPGILDDLAAESLVWRMGGLAVWLPYRARRWPWPSMAT